MTISINDYVAATGTTTPGIIYQISSKIFKDGKTVSLITETTKCTCIGMSPTERSYIHKNVTYRMA